MKRIVITALILVLITASVMTLTGCQGVIDLKNDNGIIETSYMVDKETGEFTAVAIIQNNKKDTIFEGMYMAHAYDENGSSIEAKTREHDGQEIDCSLFDTCCWLGSGEKTAIVITSKEPGNDETILDYYNEIPDKIEWEATGMNFDGTLEPHGLSITECRETYSGENGTEYEITIHNDSSTDYALEPALGTLIADMRPFTFSIGVVYRDSDGKIKDAKDLYIDFEQQGGIDAGSDKTYTGFTGNTGNTAEEDLEPEFYIMIDWSKTY